VRTTGTEPKTSFGLCIFGQFLNQPLPVAFSASMKCMVGDTCKHRNKYKNKNKSKIT